ncbi:hypothetical protein GBAR_LOCUS7524 [Geodia barretti]|nr:hypothetical protein GBAR_LOCUS7524 [Geodia barretti]
MEDGKFSCRRAFDRELAHLRMRIVHGLERNHDVKKEDGTRRSLPPHNREPGRALEGMADPCRGVTEEEEEEEEDSLEQLRFVFNLCDRDRDGVISVDEFRQIGRDHFDKTKPMEVLIQQIDPMGTGRVTFSMFRAGIETFLTSRSARSRSTSQGSSNIDLPSSPTECSSMLEEAFGSDSLVHPLFPSSHSLIPNGYHTDSSPPSCDLTSLSGDGEDDAGTPLHSSPLPLRRQSLPAGSAVRDIPGGFGRLRAGRHSQLAIPVSPALSRSKCSTPAEQEAEEMVSQLSDQLDDLSSKLEYLEEDQRSSLGARERLRREKEALQER